MAIDTYSRSRSSVATKFIMIIGLVLLVGFLTLTLLPARVDHIGKHARAPGIRQRHRNGLCDETKIYYAPSSGRLMILCLMSDEDADHLWGGIIYKITEVRGEDIIPKEGGAEEWTVFAGNWRYWQGRIDQGRFRLIANFPIIQRYAKMKGWIK